MRLLDGWYSDNRRQVSRPKVLFTVFSIDVLLVMASGIVACAMSTAPDALPLPTLMIMALAVGVGVVMALQKGWSYTIAALRNPSRQAARILAALLVVFAGLGGALYLTGREPVPRTSLVVWLALASVALVASRIAIARVMNALARAGRLVRRTVVVGGGGEAEDLIRRFTRSDDANVRILGVFDDRQDARSPEILAGYARLGTFEDLAQFCREQGVDLLIVTVPPAAEKRMLQILQQLLTLPVDIRISALGSKLRLHARAYSYIGDVPMLAVLDKPLTDWERVVKNIEDRVLGALLLALAAPVMAGVALAVRLDSKGPILFTQKRYGFNNELINVFKFRSMHVEQSDADAARLVTKNDPRVTRVGRVIRKTSLDELPQLLNVLRGELSLVGPRPHATQAKADSELYEAVMQGYFARHRVKPGITGWAQVNGWRGETDTREKLRQRVEHDLYYIENWSVLLDLYIIALTPIALLNAKNAY